MTSTMVLCHHGRGQNDNITHDLFCYVNYKFRIIRLAKKQNNFFLTINNKITSYLRLISPLNNNIRSLTDPDPMNLNEK